MDTGYYQWTVESEIVGGFLIDGSLSLNYYSDNTIKQVSNNIITYQRVRDVSIKSEREAYEELMDGKFRYFTMDDNIEIIHISGVELDYFLDSKGYYQPVYSFHSTIDGQEYTIHIPGLRQIP